MTNNCQTYYPNANAVLLENGNNQFASPAMATAVPSAPTAGVASTKESSFRNQYVTAQVVGSDVSPFSTRLLDATETHVTATALGPSSNKKTLATKTTGEEERQEPTFVYQPPQQSSVPYNSPNDYNDHNGPNGTIASLPTAALEDPLHKKKRRRFRRRVRMLAGGAAGCVVGTIVLGPFGAVPLGVAGASIARSASKVGERRKDRKIFRHISRMQQQHERFVINTRR